MQSVLTPSTSFLFFKPSTPCPHSFVVGYWFLECSFSGVIRAGCRSLQGVFCGCVSSEWVNVIFGVGWLELGMATYTEDISSVLWLCLTPLCDNFSSLQLFLSYLFFLWRWCLHVAVPCSCNTQHCCSNSIQLFLESGSKGWTAVFEVAGLLWEGTEQMYVPHFWPRGSFLQAVEEDWGVLTADLFSDSSEDIAGGSSEKGQTPFQFGEVIVEKRSTSVSETPVYLSPQPEILKLLSLFSTAETSEVKRCQVSVTICIITANYLSNCTEWCTFYSFSLSLWHIVAWRYHTSFSGLQVLLFLESHVLLFFLLGLDLHSLSCEKSQCNVPFTSEVKGSWKLGRHKCCALTTLTFFYP